MGTTVGADPVGHHSVTGGFPRLAFDASVSHALDAAFFARPSAMVARELLGLVLVSTAGGPLTGGVIVETEAYLGADDPGSHAATRGITARNRVMYGPPGHAYVYFTYGNHHMLNLVTEPEGVAGAVLVRAIEPLWGLDVMEARRGRSGIELTNGPGKLARALGIDLSCNDSPLGDTLSVLRPAWAGVPDEVGTSGRIGLSAGSELPLRYFIAGNPFVSKARSHPR